VALEQLQQSWPHLLHTRNNFEQPVVIKYLIDLCVGWSKWKKAAVATSPATPVSYFEIVFSVLTGFSVNFTLGKQAVGIYSGIYKDLHQSKGNMSTEVFDCEKIETDIVYNLQWSQNNGT
jgi:hypothetical protein